MRLIEKEKITYFVGVPTMSLELMNHPDRDKYDLSSLTDITAGGAPRPVSHVERLQQEFPKAQPALGYGLTETNAVGCSNFWGNYAAKPASTGRAQKPFVELAILGAGDAHLPTGERGEIAIRSAANIKCYWRGSRSDRGRSSRADGYVRTGDVGYLDEDGYLFIVDRKKDIIIRGGENISRRRGRGGDLRLPRRRRGRRVRSARRAPGRGAGRRHLCAATAAAWTKTSLRAFLERRIAAFKIPARFIFSDEPLPRLGTGKIDRVALKAQARALKLVDRRTLLIGGGAGVGLIVAFALWPRELRQRARAGEGEQAFGHYIKIARDGQVTVAVPQAETGQGIWTGLAQIVADELGAAWE